jgi:hypothetical protein
LFGQTVQVWRRQTLRGSPTIIVDVPGGYRRTISIDWTDLRPSTPCPQFRGRLALFDPWVLVGLTRVVAEKLTSMITGSESRRFEPDQVIETPVGRRERRGPRARVRDARSSAARRDRALVRRGGSSRSSRRRS